jgi:DNA replicative helicase MCM subunit Mcm2 (Cdc46/Mcm family)
MIKTEKMIYKTPTFICSNCHLRKSIDQRDYQEKPERCLSCKAEEEPKS